MPSAHYNAINHLLKLCGVDAEGHKSGAQIDLVISVDCPTGDIYISPKPYPDVLVVVSPDGSAKFSTEEMRRQHIGDDAWAPFPGN